MVASSQSKTEISPLAWPLVASSTGSNRDRATNDVFRVRQILPDGRFDQDVDGRVGLGL